MKANLISLLLLFSAISSSQNIRSNSDDWKFKTFTSSSKIYIDNNTAKEGMPIDVSFTYPVSVPPSMDLKKMQSTFVWLFLHNVLFDDFDGLVFSSSPKEAFDAMVSDYTHTAKQYATFFKDGQVEEKDGRFADYEENLNCSVLFQNEYVVSVSTTHRYYTGRADGAYTDSMLYYIDKRDGMIITLDSLFNPDYHPILSALVQGVIAQRGLTEVKSEFINLDPNMRLENKVASESFYFSRRGMVFVYSAAGIAIPPQGVVEVTIPYNLIYPLVNEKYISVIQSLPK